MERLLDPSTAVRCESVRWGPVVLAGLRSGGAYLVVRLSKSKEGSEGGGRSEDAGCPGEVIVGYGLDTEYPAVA